MLKMHKATLKTFSCIYFQRIKTSVLNFIVRNLAATWRKLKSILSELISVPKNTSKFIIKLVYMEGQRYGSC